LPAAHRSCPSNNVTAETRMTRTKFALCLLAPCLFALTPLAAAAQTPFAAGNWLVSANYFGTPIYVRLNLQQNGDKLTGTYRGFKLEGTLHGDTFHLSATDEQGNTEELNGTITNGTLQATDTETDADNKANPVTLKITANLAPALTHTTPQRHEFTPTVFYRQFSALNKPVLTINPG